MPSDAEITHAKEAERQRRAFDWALATYGERTRLRRYQAFRFIEEAMELAQTQGLGLDDLILAAKYVSERKVGDTKTEIGDVRVCLDIMAENLGVSVDSCHTTALSRIHGLDADRCRMKDEAKVAFGMI